MYADYRISKKKSILQSSKINKDIIGNFTIIPRRAMTDNNLHKRPVLFQILCMMSYYANNQTQQLFVSQARLSQITGKHQSTISRQIKKLVKLGYIRILKTGSPLSFSKVKTSRYKIIFFD